MIASLATGDRDMVKPFILMAILVAGAPSPATGQALRAAASIEPDRLQLDVTVDDYPAVARRQLIQGATSIAVQFGRSGEVTSCQITASVGFWALDEKACSLAMTRGRRLPLGDRAPSSGNTTVNWRLVGVTAEEIEEARVSREEAEAFAKAKAAQGGNLPTPAWSTQRRRR